MPYPVKLPISGITSAMEFIPLTLYFLRTSSRVLLPIFTLKNFSNFLTPPKTTSKCFTMRRVFWKYTCPSKEASPTVCSYFRHFAVGYFFLWTNNTLIYSFFILTWHRLRRDKGTQGTASRWEPSVRLLGLMISINFNIRVLGGHFTIRNSSFDILQNKAKWTKVIPVQWWLNSLDQFIRCEGCFEVFTNICSSTTNYFPGYKYKGACGVELDRVEVFLAKVTEFVGVEWLQPFHWMSKNDMCIALNHSKENYSYLTTSNDLYFFHSTLLKIYY